MTMDITTAIGQVRLTTSDNDPTALVFTDGEINYFLTVHGGSIPMASAAVLEAWAAKYGQSADKEMIGMYSYSQNIVAKMLKLAERLRKVDASTPYMTWAEMDLASTGDPTIT